MFISWSPLFFYLSTQIKGKKDALFFGYEGLMFDFSSYGEGKRIIFFYAIYLVALYFLTKKFDVHIREMIDQKVLVIFHSAIISLIIMLASMFIQPDFYLIFKLGIIWLLALIQYLLSELHMK